MTVRYFPRFSKEGYSEARTRFPNLDLPRTWDEWANRIYQKSAQAASAGDSLVLVDVNLDDFAIFADEANLVGDFRDLQQYVDLRVTGRGGRS